MKNKILLIIIFLVCICSIPSVCFANFEFDIDNKHYSLPDFEQYENTFIYFNNTFKDGFDVYTFSGSVSQFEFYEDFVDWAPARISFSFSATQGGSYLSSYRYNIKTGSMTCLADKRFYDEGKGFSGGNASGVFVYSNFDIIDREGNFIFGDSTKIKFNLTVVPTEKTVNVPVKIFTDWYSLDDFSDILVYYSYDEKKWEKCSWARYFNTETQQEESLWRFELDVYNNDTYYFKFIDLRSNREEYKTIVVDNIVYTQDNPGDYVDGKFDPTPFLRL